MADWKFYGRREQLADLERMLDRKRWFFANVTGRRRIGKTTLNQRQSVCCFYGIFLKAFQSSIVIVMSKMC